MCCCQQHLPTFGRPLWAFPRQRLPQVICVGVKQLKVFGPIVARILIYVMNNLARQKPATKHSLGHQAMLPNIAIAVCVWVIWKMTQNVPGLVKNSPTLPAGMLRARLRPSSAHLKPETLASLVHNLGTAAQQLPYLSHCFSLLLVPLAHLLNRPVDLVVPSHLRLR
jgi:hypothetical protein